MLPLCIWYLPEETCFVLTGAAEEGVTWYPAWPRNVPSTHSADRDAEQVSRQFCEIKAELEEAAPASSPLSPPESPHHEVLAPIALPTGPTTPASPAGPRAPACPHAASLSLQAGWHSTAAKGYLNSPAIIIFGTEASPSARAAQLPRQPVAEVCGDEEPPTRPGQPQAGFSCPPREWGAQHGQSSTRLHQSHLCPPPPAPELPPRTHLHSHGPEHASVVVSIASPWASCKGTHNM